MRAVYLALALAICALLGVVGVVAVGPTSNIAGTAVPPPAPPVKPGADSTLAPLPTLPGTRWKADARRLFGDRATSHLVLVAGNEKVGIAKALPTSQGPGLVTAVDMESGRGLWAEPSGFLASDCVYSRDQKLACTKYSNDEPRPSMVGFLDPATGKLLFSKNIEKAGYATLYRAGDGFLVKVTKYGSGTDVDVTLYWYSSDGSRSWTRQLPTGHDRVVLSEAGNVVAGADFGKNAQVFALDTGAQLYDGTADYKSAVPAGQPGTARLDVTLNAAGFAISASGAYRTANTTDRLMLFDSLGVKRMTMPGWRLTGYVSATEEAQLPVVREDEAMGVWDTQTNRLLWQRESNSFDDPTSLAGTDFLVVSGGVGAGGGYEWELFNKKTGLPGLKFRVGTQMDSGYQGFDGQRLIFEGDEEGAYHGPGAFSAIDITTGSQVWRIKDHTSADYVNFNVVGPYLFRYDASRNGSVPSISRLAAVG